MRKSKPEAVASFCVGEYRKLRRTQPTLAGTDASVDSLYRIVAVSPLQGAQGPTFLYRLAEVSPGGEPVNLVSKEHSLELTQWKLKHHTREACLFSSPPTKLSSPSQTDRHTSTSVLSGEAVSSRGRKKPHAATPQGRVTAPTSAVETAE